MTDRPADDDYLSEDDLDDLAAYYADVDGDGYHPTGLQLVAEVREHRALLADVRVVHSGDAVSLTDYHDALRRIREALAKETR